MKCPRCSAPLPNESHFCNKCGLAIQTQPNPVSSPRSSLNQKKRNDKIGPFVFLVTLVFSCILAGYLIDANRPGDRQDAVAIYSPPSTPTPVPPKSYNTIDVRNMAKDPDSYSGRNVRFEGEVFSIEVDDGTAFMQMWVRHPNGDEYDRESVIVVFEGQTDGVYEESQVYVEGTGGGAFEGTNGFGGAIRSPVVYADRIRY